MYQQDLRPLDIGFSDIEPTTEQKAILQLLADGLSQKQIAAALGISYECTRSQLWKFRQRMAAYTTENLLALAVVRGWVWVSGQIPK